MERNFEQNLKPFYNIYIAKGRKEIYKWVYSFSFLTIVDSGSKSAVACIGRAFLFLCFSTVLGLGLRDAILQGLLNLLHRGMSTNNNDGSGFMLRG